MSEYIITDEQITENRRLHGKKLLVMPVIVRCKDCRYFKPELYNYISCEFLLYNTGADDFCSYGERKTDDD